MNGRGSAWGGMGDQYPLWPAVSIYTYLNPSRRPNFKSQRRMFTYTILKHRRKRRKVRRRWHVYRYRYVYTCCQSTQIAEVDDTRRASDTTRKVRTNLRLRRRFHSIPCSFYLPNPTPTASPFPSSGNQTNRYALCVYMCASLSVCVRRRVMRNVTQRNVA